MADLREFQATVREFRMLGHSRENDLLMDDECVLTATFCILCNVDPMARYAPAAQEEARGCQSVLHACRHHVNSTSRSGVSK
jgi:hypothetical protein